MRALHAVIGIDRIEILHGRHDLTVGDVITSEFIGHQPARFTTLAFEQSAEKAFSCPLIAPALHENIKDIPVLIHGTPEILALPLNGDKDFIDMPGIA